MNTTLFTTIGIAICLTLGFALIVVGNVFLISLIISAIKLIKTNKIITMTTNSKGEFYRAGMPEGTYIIYSFKKTIKYGAGRYEADYSAVFDKNKTTNFHFIPVEGTVINMGKISLEISIKDIGYYSWRVDWDKDFEKTKRYFSEHHPDSAWLDKEWITRHKSLERHLTLFP